MALEPGRIVLERSETTGRPGTYGLGWFGGHAVIGPILARDADTVTRRLADVNGYLVPGIEAGFESSVFAGDPRRARGLSFEEVSIEGELGPMPAWLIPGSLSTWVIVVHGINDDPQVGLRIAPQLQRLGYPSLHITYRDDLGAPESPDGHHHLGLTEWRDVQAASRYALRHGAERLVLIGYSMGGAIVTQFMQRSALAGRVSAIVLDAPVLDWRETIAFNAERMGLPGFLSKPVEWAIGMRIDADWDSLEAIDHAEHLDLPVLLFHGEDDDVVPIETSDELAETLPERVTYHRVPRAGHTQAWNVAPGLYGRRLRDFLERSTKAADLSGPHPSPETDRARPEASGSKR